MTTSWLADSGSVTVDNSGLATVDSSGGAPPFPVITAKNTITITLPSARKDGGPLPLSAIATVTVTKQVGTPQPAATGGHPTFTAPVLFETLNPPFTSNSVVLVDPNPDFGLVDQYNVVVTDLLGYVSDPIFAQVLVGTLNPMPAVVGAGFTP